MLAFHQPDAPAGFSEGDRQCRSRLAGADDQNVKVRGNPSVNLRLLLIASGFDAEAARMLQNFLGRVSRRGEADRTLRLLICRSETAHTFVPPPRGCTGFQAQKVRARGTAQAP